MVLHLDEGHVHIHILVMNTADPKLDANKLHAGKVAAVESGGVEVVKGKLTLLYLPEIIARMKSERRDEVSTPIRKLISGFLELVLQLSKRMQGSEGLDRHTEPKLEN